MIKCLLVDDEPYALELLNKYIADFHDVDVVGSCRNIQSAIPLLQTKEIDLIFLDVKMPKVSGIEFLKEIHHRPEVILTTAYREYALDAYELGVLDYLLKPISFMRFAKAIERYKEKVRDVADIMDHPIVFKSGFEYHRIRPVDILYIQSAKEYVSIVCNDTKYLVRGSMGEMLKKLPDTFIQVHKSYIVPVVQVKSILSSVLQLNDGTEIPIGRSFLKHVRAAVSDMK